MEYNLYGTVHKNVLPSLHLLNICYAQKVGTRLLLCFGGPILGPSSLDFHIIFCVALVAGTVSVRPPPPNVSLAFATPMHTCFSIHNPCSPLAEGFLWVPRDSREEASSAGSEGPPSSSSTSD